MIGALTGTVGIGVLTGHNSVTSMTNFNRKSASQSPSSSVRSRSKRSVRPVVSSSSSVHSTGPTRSDATGPKRTRLVQLARNRAERKGIPFNITKDDISIPEKCPVLGITMKFTKGRRMQTHLTPTIDRIDPAKGYVKGNVIVVSWRVNWLKGDMSVHDAAKLFPFYKRFL